MVEFEFLFSKKASDLINLLKEKHGDLILQQSSGCCDGTAPLCTLKEGTYIGSQMILIGKINDVPYYVEKNFIPFLNKLPFLYIDVIQGLGISFSLESAENLAFVCISKKEKPL